MKARYQYRIYPTVQQRQSLAQAFGCTRVVWNDALSIYKEAHQLGLPRPTDVDKRCITRCVEDGGTRMVE